MIKFIKLNKKSITIILSSVLVFILFMQLVVVPNNWINSQTFTTYKEFFGVLSSIAIPIGIISLIIMYNSYKDTQVMNAFNILSLFNKRYSEILQKLGKIDKLKEEEKEISIADYYNLCNEQLSYIKRGLIPHEEETTWINGMKEQILFFNKLDIEYTTAFSRGKPRLTSLIKIILEQPEVSTDELINRIKSDNV